MWQKEWGLGKQSQTGKKTSGCQGELDGSESQVTGSMEWQREFEWAGRPRSAKKQGWQKEWDGRKKSADRESNVPEKVGVGWKSETDNAKTLHCGKEGLVQIIEET